MDVKPGAARILIAGGGTGGHVYPALAIIEKLKEKGPFEFLYVGGRDGIETRIVPQHHIPMDTLWISGFARSLTLKNLLFPFKLLSSMLRSWRILRRFKPAVAVGTGGYVCGPILYAASRMGIPVLIQEQDVYPGVTTRLLTRYARRICIPFEAARKYFTDVDDKVRVTGNPVRQGLADGSRKSALQKWGLDAQKLTVFIFGGSQGARAINNAMLTIAPKLAESGKYQFLWQTGTALENEVTSALKPHPAIVVTPYIDDMSAAYAAADVIVCRAGASSLTELALVAKSAILIPYPYAAGDHQVHNSQLIADAGAALMVKEGDGWQAKLDEALRGLLTDDNARSAQSAVWKTLARPQASEAICREIVEIMA